MDEPKIGRRSLMVAALFATLAGAAEAKGRGGSRGGGKRYKHGGGGGSSGGGSGGCGSRGGPGGPRDANGKCPGWKK